MGMTVDAADRSPAGTVVRQFQVRKEKVTPVSICLRLVLEALRPSLRHAICMRTYACRPRTVQGKGFGQGQS